MIHTGNSSGLRCHIADDEVPSGTCAWIEILHDLLHCIWGETISSLSKEACGQSALLTTEYRRDQIRIIRFPSNESFEMMLSTHNIHLSDRYWEADRWSWTTLMTKNLTCMQEIHFTIAHSVGNRFERHYIDRHNLSARRVWNNSSILEITLITCALTMRPFVRSSRIIQARH